MQPFCKVQGCGPYAFMYMLHYLGLPYMPTGMQIANMHALYFFQPCMREWKLDTMHEKNMHAIVHEVLGKYLPANKYMNAPGLCLHEQERRNPKPRHEVSLPPCGRLALPAAGMFQKIHRRDVSKNRPDEGSMRPARNCFPKTKCMCKKPAWCTHTQTRTANSLHAEFLFHRQLNSGRSKKPLAHMYGHECMHAVPCMDDSLALL